MKEIFKFQNTQDLCSRVLNVFRVFLKEGRSIFRICVVLQRRLLGIVIAFVIGRIIGVLSWGVVVRRYIRLCGYLHFSYTRCQFFLVTSSLLKCSSVGCREECILESLLIEIVCPYTSTDQEDGVSGESIDRLSPHTPLPRSQKVGLIYQQQASSLPLSRPFFSLCTFNILYIVFEIFTAKA